MVTPHPTTSRVAAALLLTLCLTTALASQGRPSGLRRAVERFEQAIAEEHVLGAVLLVTRGDEVLLYEALGHRDAARERPMKPDALFRMASNTKAVTAAAVLTLVDEGKVGLDDPVAKWFPTFTGPRGGAVTIRQLLTHSSGLRIPTLFLQPLTQRSEQNPDAPNLVQECARFGEVGPAEEPGKTYSYSNPGYNLLAGVVEVVTGEPFADYVQRRFYGPLGMVDSCHHETVADNDRMSEVVKEKDGGGWSVRWRPGGAPTLPFVRGSGGMISTAQDYERFARLFLDGGARGRPRRRGPHAAAFLRTAPHTGSRTRSARSSSPSSRRARGCRAPWTRSGCTSRSRRRRARARSVASPPGSGRGRSG